MAMRRSIFVEYLILMTVGWIVGGSVGAGSAPTGLMCELLRHPDQVEITDPQPDFGWIVPCTMPDDRQTAYQVQVATSLERLSTDTPDTWDSGRVAGNTSVYVQYAGRPLQPGRTYYWRVRTWNRLGRPSDYSAAQMFRTAVDLGTYRTARQRLQVHRIRPRKIVRKGPDHWFVDFGRAAFGTVELTLNWKSGHGDDRQTIEVHLGEKLLRAETIDRRPPGTIRYRRMVVKVEPGTKVYRVKIPPDRRNTGPAAIKMPPELFEVIPFRYAEIVGWPGPLAADDVTQLAVAYPFDETAAEFACDDRILNAVWDLCKYSIRATHFCDVYVDGDRERIPYEADAYINQLSHYGLDREYALARHSHEYLMTHPTWPTECILHSVLMAWADYLYTGDPESIAHFYDDLRAKTLIALARRDGLISTAGPQSRAFLRSIHIDRPIRDLVDWPPAAFTRDGRYGERDGYDMRPVNTVVNAFHYEALVCLGRIAAALGKQSDAADLAHRTERLRGTFNATFFDPTRGVYVDGEGTTHAALHANLFPVAFGLVPDSTLPGVLDYVESRGMACSVYAAHYLLDGLYAAGREGYALDLMTAMHDRSWFNMLRVGSTVTLEAWDWKFKNNLDWNHAWGAAPANIIPRRLVGVEPIEPGCSRVRIQPRPGWLRWFHAKVPTIRGPVVVEFRRGLDQTRLDVELPANMVAEVVPPLSEEGPLASAARRQTTVLSVDGQARPVPSAGPCVLELGAGQHRITIGPASPR